MKAIYIYGKDSIAMKDIDEIPNNSTEETVLIKVKYVGICGSDLHYLEDGTSGAAVIREPLIPGHELSGELLEDMSYKGQTFPKGTNVTVHPATYGEEIESAPNNPEVWPNGTYLGSARYLPHTQGAMIEQIYVNKSQIIPLPDNVSLKLGALAEPLSVGLHGITLANGVKNKNVLVSGAGPIGILAAGAAYTLGAKSVTITDVLDKPLERAKQLGDINTINVKITDLTADTYDVILECTGAPLAVTSAFNAVSVGGTIIQIGNIQNKEVALNLSPINAKQITYHGSYRFNNEIEKAVELLGQNPLIGNVITQIYNFNDYIEAFDMAKDTVNSSKVVIEF